MDIVEVADGQLIEPPLTVEQRLAEHCAYSEATFTNGDYFHLLAKDAAALIASQAARIRELEEGLEPFALVAERDIGDDEDDGDRFRPISDRNARAPLLRVGDLRRARSLVYRKGGE